MSAYRMVLDEVEQSLHAKAVYTFKKGRRRRRCHLRRPANLRATITHSIEPGDDDECQQQWSEYEQQFESFADAERLLVDDIFCDPLMEYLYALPTHDKVVALRINYIDRGIADLRNEFPDQLARAFPNLRLLMFRQNYSLPEAGSIHDFMRHPFIRRVRDVAVFDSQSSWDALTTLLDPAILPGPTGSRYISCALVGAPANIATADGADESGRTKLHFVRDAWNNAPPGGAPIEDKQHVSS
jgi:hypothetical protein